MKNKGLFVLFLILGTVFGITAYTLGRPVSPFIMQEEYARQLEDKLIQLLEPAAGIGNVRASVQADIRHQHITKKMYNPLTLTETKIRESGPVLTKQSVSVLINKKGKKRLSAYRDLIKAAVGFDAQRGDLLSVKMLPFAVVPLWTLGLTPLMLVRIGAVLIVLILAGCFWLFQESRKSHKTEQVFYMSDEVLWQQLEQIAVSETISFLEKKSPELIAFVLYRLPQEKAAEIISMLPNTLVNQVVLHLNYIEKLNPSECGALLKQAEKEIRTFLKTRNTNRFNELLKWSDEEIQNLLHYVSKQDLAKALQNCSDNIQHIFERNIPPSLWQELKYQGSPCSVAETIQAQKKIMRLAALLKEAD